MKKYFYLFVALLFCAGVLSGTGYAEEAAKAKEVKAKVEEKKEEKKAEKVEKKEDKKEEKEEKKEEKKK